MAPTTHSRPFSTQPPRISLSPRQIRIIRSSAVTRRREVLRQSMKAPCGPNKLVACLSALIILAGCASTQDTNRQELVSGNIPRPAQIWVYDFAATPADVPPESALAGQASGGAAPQTAQQIAEGRKLGSEIAAQL